MNPREMDFSECARRIKETIEHFDCHHDDQKLVKKQRLDGLWFVVSQCQKCGRNSKAISQKINGKKVVDAASMPDQFDQSIVDRRRALISESMKWCYEPVGGERVYQSYLMSDAWREKRRLVLERDNNTCASCGSPGSDVHHKTYERIFDERLDDLVTLCRSCHEKTHNMEQ